MKVKKNAVDTSEIKIIIRDYDEQLYSIVQ